METYLCERQAANLTYHTLSTPSYPVSLHPLPHIHAMEFTEELSPHEQIRAANVKLGEIAKELHPYEARWRDRQQFLASRGYMLRHRYHSGWVPSW